MINTLETKNILTLQSEKVSSKFIVWRRITKKLLFQTVKKFTSLLKINSITAKQTSSRIMSRDVTSFNSKTSKARTLLNKLHRFTLFSRKSLITNRKLTLFQSSIRRRNLSKLITCLSSM